MKVSTLMILAGGITAALTVKWSDLRTRRTLEDVYREAKTGRIRSTAYSKLTTLASLVLIIVGIYMAIVGD